jgi:hypothetical protein
MEGDPTLMQGDDQMPGVGVLTLAAAKVKIHRQRQQLTISLDTWLKYHNRSAGEGKWVDRGWGFGQKILTA